jgi:hypothetical protein
MRFFVALACLVTTTSVGYAYARTIEVEGWQLWLWALCVLLTALVLLPPRRPRVALGWACVGLAALFAAALVLRAVDLEHVPGGLHVDEMGVADFALRQVFPRPNATIYPFRPGPSSQPALYHYIVRFSLLLTGQTIAGLRVSSAVAGALAVLATYALVATLQDRGTGAFAAILMAAYHYHVHWSRLGLNNVWDTLWVPLMLASYAWGWKTRWSGGAVLSGLALGFSQYFYAGSRLGVPMLAFTGFLLWRQDRDQRRLLVFVGKVILTAAVVAAPTVLCALRDPAPYFHRAGVVFGWQRNAIAEFSGGRLDLPAYLAYFWHQIWRSAGAYVAVPDVTGFYGPGVPFLIGLGAPLFLAGLFWAIRSGNWVPVLWIALITFLGGFMLTGAPSSSHLIASIPAICWLVAIPLGWLMRHEYPYLAVFALLVIIGTDLLFYFGVYVPRGPRDLIHSFPPGPFR